jgi:ParB-like chromosome segregation protein Spo0J
MNAAQTTTTEAVVRKEAAGVLKRSSRFFLDPRCVVIDPAWNNRIDMGNIEELADSIKHEVERDPEGGGLHEEIGVQRIPKDSPLRFLTNPLDKPGEEVEKEFVVRYGARRTTSVWFNMKRGVQFPVGIPAKILDKAQDIQASKIAMIAENVGQKPLLPLEEAAGYKQLKDGWPELGIKGMSIKDICKAVGRAVPHVTEMLALLEADDSLKDAVQSGQIGKQTAKVIAKNAKGDKEAQKRLVAEAKAAKNKKGGVAAVKNAAINVKRAKQGKKLKLRALTDAQIAKLGTSVSADLLKKMKEAGKDVPKEFSDETIQTLREWVCKDDKLALAFTLGSLEGLRAAAGAKVELSL